VLGTIHVSVPKGEEVAGGWRRLQNEELQNLHASANVIRVTKSRRMGWARHVARLTNTTP
jgi:hypothetical protein